MSELNRILRGVSAFTRALSRPIPPPRIQSSSRPKLGMALGGGFARGVAHIGVLKALEQEDIQPDYVAGTSVGAVIGALYCSGMSPREMEEIAALLKFSDFARFSFSRLGLWNNDRMTALLRRILKTHTFEELQIPLAVTATDFVTGDPVVFTSGPLIDAVRASCAYPGFFHPVNIGGRLLVDGLLAHPVPAAPLKQLGAEKVLAVHFPKHWVRDSGPKHFMEVIGQCFSIAQANVCSFWQVHADVVLEPEVSNFAYDAFHKAPELVAAGEAAAMAAMEKIRALIGVSITQGSAEAKPAKTPKLTPSTLPVTG